MNSRWMEMPVTDHPNNRERVRAEKAAQGSLLKLSRGKRFLVLALEAFLFPVVRGLQLLHSLQPPRRIQEIRKIVVVEYWNLGDIVILLPFLQNLRLHYPRARIALLVSRKVLSLLEGQNLVDELVPVRVPWAEYFVRWKKYNPFSSLWVDLFRALLALRRQHFDLALSGRMDFRDNLLIWVIGARQRVGYAVGGGRQLLTDVVTPDLSRPHRSQLWLRLLEHLGKPVFDWQPRLFLRESERLFALKFLMEKGIQPDDFIVGFHAGARIPTRSWGEENFSAVEGKVASAFPVKALWFCDPNERDQVVSLPDRVIRVSLPIRQFIAVLSRCHLLICNDSGPMHIATALGVPVVAVFGPQQPAWFGPMGHHNRVVIRPEFWCRPCSDYCIFDQPYCLRTITIEDVGEAALSAVREISGLLELTSAEDRQKTQAEAYTPAMSEGKR